MGTASRSTRAFARICAYAAFAVVALGAFAQSASAKGEMRAILDQPVPADAKPGSTLAVNWKLQVKRGEEFEPFGAGEVYFRLVGRDPGQASETVVDGRGSFSARVKVPPSGIERVEIGIYGMRIIGGREGASSRYPIPIVGRSLNQSSTESDESTNGSPEIWIGLVGGLALVALMGFAFRSRRAPDSAAAG
ncbi:MAG: hypothetical protein WAP35_05810 [Solirubrobacterales bacterium]